MNLTIIIKKKHYLNNRHDLTRAGRKRKKISIDDGLECPRPSERLTDKIANAKMRLGAIAYKIA
ncbi:MAG: hypothetical protein CVV13_02080 [Gammaproteobacteria bacterium HGW-Gammaproteobacteria-3]|jgi:hypothetical protein|nr:MAG: hypothetical protein CVV13_02080 [Gammaproteobacteria bacterium HGW-Gammaproteobacteria-3]